jgi:hypothetical protein
MIAYSQFTGVNFLDSSSKTVLKNYDGKSPSGFTNSNFTGMTTNCSVFTQTATSG